MSAPKRPFAGKPRAALLGAVLATLAMVCSAPASAASAGAFAWGANESGQLGNGTTTPSNVPVAVTGLGSGVKAVSAGFRHSLALLYNGTVVEWGGGGTVPVAVSGLGGVTAISAGGYHNLALLANGTVLAWGNNEFGQLGDGSTEGSAAPVPVSGLSSVTAISAGYTHSLALLSNGTVMAWGHNDVGQLGNGTTVNSDVPVPVGGLSGATAISAGGYHSLALLSGGGVMAWGYNRYGQLGNASMTNSDTPVAVSALTGVAAISAGGFHSLALMTGGTVTSWGNYYQGASNDVPVAVAGLTGVTAISAGFFHDLARLESGTAMTRGNNESGQLGNATNQGGATPVAVSGLSGVTLVGAGGYDSLAYSPPPPTVTAVNPSSGPLVGGTSVTVTGTNFGGATAVKFGANNATSFKVNSETSITAISPAGMGTVDVTVTTPGGTSATSSADRFSYVHVGGETLPELGRCVAATPNTGEYKNGLCVSWAEGRGRNNWLPGPGEKKKFAGSLSGVALETVGKVRITCTSGASKGEYTGPKSQTVTITLKGCERSAGHEPCQGAGAASGEIVSSALEGSLGFIKRGEKPIVGWDLKHEPSLATFECGSGGKLLASLEGSVIAPIKASNIDKMFLEFSSKYTAAHGVQVPEQFEGGVKDTLSLALVSGVTKTTEQAGLVATYTTTNEELLEVKAKCEGTC